MKSISKKITVYIFVGLLVFCSTSTTYYRSAHAMEWVGGALAFEEALKWLLASVGIISAGGMTADYWEQHGDDFVDYCEQQNITNSEVAEWQMKLCQGVLDKASSCWSAFKDWASSLVANNSSNPSLSGNTIDTYLSAINNHYNINLSSGTGWNDVSIYSACVGYWSGSYYLRLFANDNPIEFNLIGSNNSASLINKGNDNAILFQFPGVDGNSVLNYSSPSSFSTSLNLGAYNNNINFALYNITPINNAINNPYVANYTISDTPGDTPGDTPVDSDFIGVDGADVSDLDIISSDLPDETNPEVSIPMPGLGASDNTISQDAYDEIIDAINNGDIPIEKGIEDIQDILRIIAYDTETDDIFPTRPDPDDPNENVKKDDVVNENKSNLGFTLAGLENVFPFCIPFDIYAFMTLLVADPVAPEFDFPIKSVNNQTEEIHVDLSPFEPVAVVVRYIFDFLFIIGLGMLTRSLIGGGSSD